MNANHKRKFVCFLNGDSKAKKIISGPEFRTRDLPTPIFIHLQQQYFFCIRASKWTGLCLKDLSRSFLCRRREWMSFKTGVDNLNNFNIFFLWWFFGRYRFQSGFNYSRKWAENWETRFPGLSEKPLSQKNVEPQKRNVLGWLQHCDGSFKID